MNFQGFVGRQKELERLEERLGQATDQQGGIFFISGEGGSGKSALLKQFTEQAQESNKKLVVAVSDCNAQTGISDPFLPFREILELLTGNTKSKLAKGEISSENASRIGGLLDWSLHILLEAAPDLIGSLIPGGVLLGAVGKVVADKTGLTDKLKRSKTEIAPIEQSQIFEQYTNFVLGISQKAPLLLIIDDLQWADEASISLLFHLSRRVEEAKILILCAYRSDEVALGRGGQRHPLEKVLNEFKRYYGDILIDLEGEDSGEKRKLIDDYIDLEPNALDETFRQALLKQTNGHPLFFVELLHYMITGQDLVQNEKGEWVEGKNLNWKALPARVEGVIEERIGRLDEESRELLRVASVEGEEFTAQVLSIIQSNDELSILRKLSGVLENKHRLVHEIGEKQIAENTVSIFEFSHNLYQQYLYSGLGEGERRLLHKAVAHALEDLDPDNHQALAYHYTQGREAEKAIYFLLLVADEARQLYAHQEAVDHYLQALDFMESMDDEEQTARTWMKLALSYQNNFDFKSSDAAYAKAFSLWASISENRPEQSYPPAPHALRFVNIEPLTFDPTFGGEMASASYMAQLFSGLVELSPAGNVMPDVAASWELLDEGRRYIFHLREDVFWSDGVAVTAGDFEFAIKRALQAKTASTIATLHYEIKNARRCHQGELIDSEQVGIRASDDRTLEIELENPVAYFLQLLANNASFPVPEHAVKEVGDGWTKLENFVSNGAFRLASWEQGKSLVLERNPTYHRRYDGNILRVEITFVNEVEDAMQAYIDADHDFLSLELMTMDQSVKARHRFRDDYFSAPILSTTFIAFDTLSAPFDDARVRRAFALAIDRESLIGQVFRGLASPSNGGIIPPGMPGHSPEIGLPYDPDESRFLLSEAGYPAGAGFPVMEIPIRRGDTAIPDLADALKTQWLEILGVKIHRKGWGQKKLSKQIAIKKPQISISGWSADYHDPHSFLADASWNHLKNRQNLWQHKEFLRLVNKAKEVLNQEERISLYIQADRILVEEAPIIPLFYGQAPVLLKPWVKGFNPSPMGYVFIKDMIIVAH